MRRPSETGAANHPDLDVAALHAARVAFVAGLDRGGRRQVHASPSLGAMSVFRIASLTKPVTALAVLRAADRAGVPLDTPVLELLPVLEPHWRADREITLAHVLSQTSGLAAAVTAADVAALGEDDDVALRAAGLVVAAGSRHRPGHGWSYDNGNYFLAGAVLAALHGSPYEQAVADLVLRPARMTRTTFRPPEHLVPGFDRGEALPVRSYPRARRPSGGLCSTGEDLLAFAGHLRADTGTLGRVATARTAPDDNVRYGLGWALGPSGQLYVNGRLPGYRAALLVVPDQDLAAVVLTADSGALRGAATALSRAQRGTGDDLTDAIDRFAE